jgi:hypothetical protein
VIGRSRRSEMHSWLMLLGRLRTYSKYRLGKTWMLIIMRRKLDLDCRWFLLWLLSKTW